MQGGLGLSQFLVGGARRSENAYSVEQLSFGSSRPQKLIRNIFLGIHRKQSERVLQGALRNTDQVQVHIHKDLRPREGKTTCPGFHSSKAGVLTQVS